ncbi:rhodanese-like domain-containing protein, partial [Nitrolancea hollandica]|uniref:rhodanese-like domain-containing protein n=1 Tax=Nitrolancea hollandica TaxID=1206749 RepID=UPI001930A444
MTITDTIAPVLNPDALSALIAERPDVRLLDVRTPGEFESAHIPGAYNVPLDTLPEHAGEIRAAVASPVVLICRSGQRARKAEAVLGAAGMPQLHVLDGGLNSWQADRASGHAGAGATVTGAASVEG